MLDHNAIHRNKVRSEAQRLLAVNSPFQPEYHQAVADYACMSGLPLEVGRVGSSQRGEHLSAAAWARFIEDMRRRKPDWVKCDNSAGQPPEERLRRLYRQQHDDARQH